ncbi:hypothetical protein KL86CLO1_11660 [uncultured Eubacteriales bacterium]|uniref:Uncharacterized protein n=1 Tax=uncultured Eubacteriales bacterium TaxID=172733 RepID=A0A212JSS6_9FIRM|nr:hypothetical protein KL86CLO1_11660 [uncultured Eubacteriales bacterium]
MYWDGATDTEMAQAVNCRKPVICIWRKQHGYEPNDIQGRKPYKRYKITLRKTGEVLADGLIVDAAKQMQTTVVAIRSIVQKTKAGSLKRYTVEVSEVYGLTNQ